MDFDGIEACLDGKSGGVRVRGDNVVDVVAGRLLGEPHADGVEEPHRRQGRGGSPLWVSRAWKTVERGCDHA